MVRIKTTKLERSFVLLLAVLLCGACVVRGGGGGGGGGGGDDDDDDDGVGPMELTFSVRNSTGSYIFGVYIDVVGDGIEYEDGAVDFPPGTLSTLSAVTTDNVVYGTQFHVAAEADDENDWCLDWDDGGRDFDAGPELEIEIEFETGDYTGECP